MVRKVIPEANTGRGPAGPLPPAEARTLLRVAGVSKSFPGTKALTDFSLEVGAGWNKGDLRLGTSLAWNYEDAIDVTGVIDSTGAPQRYATGSLVASYMWTQEWALAASYSDQTLFGSPSNTTLSKSVLVSLQRRWAR